MTYGVRYDPEERGHLRIRCPGCGYRGWSDDTGHSPRCEPEDLTVSESEPREEHDDSADGRLMKREAQ